MTPKERRERELNEIINKAEYYHFHPDADRLPETRLEVMFELITRLAKVMLNDTLSPP